jgi:hypothetical protein
MLRTLEVICKEIGLILSTRPQKINCLVAFAVQVDIILWSSESGMKKLREARHFGLGI